MSKCLVAPLNWGLGHASRCVPLVRRLLDEGHEVVLGGDGESLTLLRKHFPKLRYTYLAPLNLRYSAGKRQVWAMLKALPQLILWAFKDHAMLKAVLREEPFDQVISDNRFGLYSNRKSKIENRNTECVYMTHQLHIMLPKGWRWAEGIASRMHARIYTRFNKVWIPDYEDPERSLAGDLSHPTQMANGKWQMANIQYIGPLSRFENQSSNRQSSNRQSYDVVAVLSGLEPHRSLLEQDILARFTNHQSPGTSSRQTGGVASAEKGNSPITNNQSQITNNQSLLLVQGLMNRPNTRIKRGNITLVPYLKDDELIPALLGAKHIIARSGYSTLMDLEALGLLTANSQQLTAKVELIPTPGQPEQEYLAKRIEQKTLFS